MVYFRYISLKGLKTISAQNVAFNLTALSDIAALEARWRAFEARNPVSFFQSWSWMGCCAAARFDDPYLFSATSNGRDIALALLNRHPTRLARQTLFLGETGRRDWDGMYVEHNGLLIAADARATLAPALHHLGQSARLVLSGVDGTTLEAVRQTGLVARLHHSTPAPYLDFTQLPPDEDALLNSFSANTRHQLRRSLRLYAAQGALRVQRAANVAQALAMLGELAALHQATWTSRGAPGAFANPRFGEFHHTLIANSFARGEIDLLRITAGATLIGCLYNFHHRGTVLSYQSGFAYDAANPHRKPGLTAHYLAMSQYGRAGVTRYDFLAGHDRYKASLSNAEAMLHWLDLSPKWSARGILGRVLSASST